MIFCESDANQRAISQLDSQSDFKVAALLVEITETVLWADIQPWLRDNQHNIQLRCRVGHGQATHHAQQAHRHTLTFGRKMVASKRCPNRARNWTTGRELLKRDYFEGRFAFAELMAHTCCHEFAHLIQSLNGWYRRGSIHNTDFYRILDRMHQSGTADRVLQSLKQQALHQDLLLEFMPSDVLPCPGAHSKRGSRNAVPASPFTPTSSLKGQRAAFRYRGIRVEGKVTRVHRKTVRIEEHGVKGVDYFRVPPSQLELVENSPDPAEVVSAGAV